MKKQSPDYQIDKVDKKIISFLMKDAMMPYTEIGHRVLMSTGTIHVRMNNLRKKVL